MFNPQGEVESVVLVFWSPKECLADEFLGYEVFVHVAMYGKGDVDVKGNRGMLNWLVRSVRGQETFTFYFGIVNLRNPDDCSSLAKTPLI